MEIFFYKKKSREIEIEWVKRMSSFFPSLVPSALDPLWFTVDRPCDDEEELSKLEEEHTLWVTISCLKL